MTQASHTDRPVTNEDILAALQGWNRERLDLERAVKALRGRVAALEASRR